MQYRAFFSYSRSDDRIANWLHRQLDGYRTPKALIGVDGALGPVPAKLHPIFRDRTDMSGGGQLSQRIEEALKESETLIVLCSPASAASPWVNREVESFIALGRTERIFPVIATGLPDTDDVERDFFPPALRGLGLLAADLRDVKQANGKLVGDGREGGRLKMLAGVLGAQLDQLIRRERSRERTRFTIVTTVATLLLILALGTGIGLSLAVKNADKARSNILRHFSVTAGQAVESNYMSSALRYALAGAVLTRRASETLDDYRLLLAAAVYDTRQGNSFSFERGAVVCAGETDRGNFFAVADGSQLSIWNSAGREMFVANRPILPGDCPGAFANQAGYFAYADFENKVHIVLSKPIRSR